MMKIVFLDEGSVTLDDIDFGALGALGEYKGYERTGVDEVVARAAGAAVVITNKVVFDAGVIGQLPELKLICVIATGYNNVDLAAAREAGVTVCNVAGYAVNAVAQHTLAMILNLMTQMGAYDRDVKAGDWGESPLFTLLRYRTVEAAGKTLGIIGMGDIGREVARLGDALRMRVIYHSRTVKKDLPYAAVTLKELLEQSDVVSIHCPLTAETEDLIGEAELGMMKRTGLVVNLGRGGIVNEEALAKALNEGRLAGAATDVLTTEPPREGNVLLKAKGMLITPHTAWATREARQTLVEETAANIAGYFAGKARNVVS